MIREVVELWRSVSDPDHLEVVVVMPHDEVPAIGDQIDIPGEGRSRVVGAWRFTGRASVDLYIGEVIVRLDVERDAAPEA